MSRQNGYWDFERARPELHRVPPAARLARDHRYQRCLEECLAHPFHSLEAIRRAQLERVKYLVEMAFRDVPVYRDKYRAAGFSPGDLRSWEDFERIPVITKGELVAAYPARRLNRTFAPSELFSTRSSGSSGQTLLIKVNQEAIFLDTLQGVRQFWLQSGMKYQPRHLLVHIYGIPCWFDRIGPYPTAFLSSLIPPARSAAILKGLKPGILSLYPSNLRALLPYSSTFAGPELLLAVTHSEQSSRSERHSWSEALGVPVLDEYGSEEATRIALELPCGHYHVCEDSVYLEVVGPKTMRAQSSGQPGLAVITNLLNEAMPFIRYQQGDYVTRSATAGGCGLGWSELTKIDGRSNDNFVNPWRREIPAGALLAA